MVEHTEAQAYFTKQMSASLPVKQARAVHPAPRSNNQSEQVCKTAYAGVPGVWTSTLVNSIIGGMLDTDIEACLQMWTLMQVNAVGQKGMCARQPAKEVRTSPALL